MRELNVVLARAMARATVESQLGIIELQVTEAKETLAVASQNDFPTRVDVLMVAAKRKKGRVGGR